jgi:hypothetical protein
VILALSAAIAVVAGEARADHLGMVDVVIGPGGRTAGPAVAAGLMCCGPFPVAVVPLWQRAQDAVMPACVNVAGQTPA